MEHQNTIIASAGSQDGWDAIEKCWPALHFSSQAFEKFLQSRMNSKEGVLKSFYELLHRLSLENKDRVFDLAEEVFCLADENKHVVARCYLASFSDADTGNFKSYCVEKGGSHARHPLEKAINHALCSYKAKWEIIFYRKVWEEFAGPDAPFHLDFSLQVETEPGRWHYWAIESDSRFVEVTTTFNLQECARVLEEADGQSPDQQSLLAYLRQHLPLHLFCFEGFFVCTAKDITVGQLIRLIINEALASDGHDKSDTWKTMLDLLEMATSEDSMHYGFYPMLRLNERFMFEDPAQAEVRLPSAWVNQEQQQELYNFLEQVFRHEPRIIWLKSIAEKSWKYPYLKNLEDKGIQSYMLVPVNHSGVFVGALEVFTAAPDALAKTILLKLEPCLPLLGILFKTAVSRFQERVEHVIKEQYTSLQPAVQWRFYEAALNYIKAGGKQEVEDIYFERVYPLYGAIDVRNSTVNRNNALRDDYLVQLNALTGLLRRLHQSVPLVLLNEKKFLCEQWISILENNSDVLQTGELAYFLENAIPMFLQSFASAYPEQCAIIEKFLNDLRDATCERFTGHQRKLERSMNTVIGCINRYVDLLKGGTSADFPCFFEKFRTDGVEYDVYIGSSIAPGRAFYPLFIQNLRLRQLMNMVDIVTAVRLLKDSLEVDIETTQLIFVHAYQIDISFRKDEKRFDVEGAYNIRYHILKKRIDKAVLKGTGERLTLPGKIAIVYFTQKDLEDFLVHIRYLQQEEKIVPDIEYLNLEDMQGVTGLKAIRITVANP
ncbi:hypothetical protein [Foetidibacter luteolus]|uniref:hypothetical protein n=1 Tax=Foetidibacter luteolus TaxID=2608880 RepID=UPI00129B2229|nr:hypothetical protein [Foetidibacter luteolus]